jgi:hypothetical protein
MAQTAYLTNSQLNGNLTLTFEEDGWISFTFGYHMLCFNTSHNHPDYLDIRDPCNDVCPSVGRWDQEKWQPVFHPYFNPFVRTTPWEQWCVSCLREVKINGVSYILEDYMYDCGSVYVGSKEQYLQNEISYWGQYTVDKLTKKITMTCKIVHEIDMDHINDNHDEINEVDKDSISSFGSGSLSSSSVITQSKPRPVEDLVWYDTLKACDDFYQTNHRIPLITSKHKQEKALGHWIKHQRLYYKKNNKCLTQERIQACEACDWWTWCYDNRINCCLSPITSQFNEDDCSDMSLDASL